MGEERGESGKGEVGGGGVWGGSRQAILSVFGPKRGRAHNNSKAIEAVIFLILKNWEN